MYILTKLITLLALFIVGANNYAYCYSVDDKVMEYYLQYLDYKLSMQDNKTASNGDTSIGYKTDEWITLSELIKIGVKCSGLDGQLIQSVIWQESNGYFYCINNNVIKVSKCFKNKKEAINFVVQQGNTNVDVGLMQVNYKIWSGIMGLSLNDLLDPKINVCAGSVILKHYLSQPSSWQWKGWRGVGYYNAGVNGDKDRQKRYAISVYKKYKFLHSKKQIQKS